MMHGAYYSHNNSNTIENLSDSPKSKQCILKYLVL